MFVKSSYYSYLFSVLLSFPLSAKLNNSLAVVITSFNNKNWYKKNLESVFNQEYNNYRVIYIDDCSKDNTGDLVEAYIKQNNQEHRVTLIKNKRWLSQMANHYKAVHMCEDSEIVVHLDGDDWLAHPGVLAIVNTFYQDPDVWITFGRFQAHPARYIQPELALTDLKLIIAQNSFRERIKIDFPFTHLRTFRAWLFKYIKLQDLLYKSSFAAMSPAPDAAFMFPMLEMAGSHCRHSTEILSIYNTRNPLSQYAIAKPKVEELTHIIVNWPKYAPLVAPNMSLRKAYENTKADLLLFSENPAKLIQTLTSINTNIKEYQTITVAADNAFFNLVQSYYPQIENLSSAIKLVFYTRQQDFKQFLLRALRSLSDYIVLFSDSVQCNRQIDLSSCIRELDKTRAHAFHLELPYPGAVLDKLHAPLSDTVIAWQYDYTSKIWNTALNSGAVLYRKADIVNIIQNMNFTSMGEFKQLWKNKSIEPRAIALSFKYVKDSY